MAIPGEFVIARHGQSEKNIIENYDCASDYGADEELHNRALMRPDWQHRLSSLGERQAIEARKAIEDKLGGVASFDALYVSPYVRTFETAAHMGGVYVSDWIADENISERNWGHMSYLAEQERGVRFPETNTARYNNAWYQSPEGGESLMDTRIRFEEFWNNVSRQHDSKRVFAVAHHDTIYAAHRVIENMLPEEWDEMYHGDDVYIGNCMMINWSSVNPNNSRDRRTKMQWKRYINPLDEQNAPYNGEWVELKKRRKYFGGELLARVNQFDRILDHTQDPEQTQPMRPIYDADA